MTQKEQELAEKCLAYLNEEWMARYNRIKTLKELALQAPHMVGEIIKWQEVKRKKVGGTYFNPIYEDMPPVEKRAVLRAIEASVKNYSKLDVYYKYEFATVRKDGELAQNNVYPHTDYEWTGEYYEPKTD